MTEAISIGGLKLVAGHERYINDFKLAFCLIFFFQALIIENKFSRKCFDNFK